MMTLLLLLSCIVPADADGDGLPWYADCDDKDPEVLDGLTWYLDFDGDDYGDPFRTLYLCEAPDDYIDHAGDCDDEDYLVPSEQLIDEDGDGFYSAWCEGGDDCDDEQAHTYPGAQEICDGRQNDCSTPRAEAEGLPERGLVIYFEQLKSGTEGESCEVASGFAGEGGSSGCVVHACPDEHFVMDGLCCVCDLSQSFSAEQLPEDAVWEIRPEASWTGFVGDRTLSFCAGEYPLHLKVDPAGKAQTATVRILGSGPWPEDSACEANDTTNLAVLQGSGAHPVISATEQSKLDLYLAALVVRGVSDCTAAEIPYSAPGLDLRSFPYLTAVALCLRDHAGSAQGSSADYGGGAHLQDLGQVLLRDLSVHENCASAGGGIGLVSVNSLTFENSTVANNRASTVGGGVLLRAELDQVGMSAYELILENNTADAGYGAGLLISGSATSAATASLESVTVTNNIGSGIGLVDAVYNQGSETPVCSRVLLNDVSFDGNTQDVDVEQVNLYSVWFGETLGEDLGTVAESTYQTEACE